MLTNDFFSSFWFTLCVIGVLVALAGIVFAATRVWRLSQPLRDWLQRSLGYSSHSSDRNILGSCNSSRQEFRSWFVYNSLCSSMADLHLSLGHARQCASTSAVGHLRRCADCLLFAIFHVSYVGYTVAVNHWYCSRGSTGWYTLCSVHGLA